MTESLMAMIATPAGARWSPDDITRAIRTFADPAMGAPEVVRVDTVQANFVMAIAGVAVLVAHVASRMPEDASLTSALRNEVMWREAADAFRTSAGYVLVAIANTQDDPKEKVRQSRVLTYVTAAVVKSMSGTGVLWSPPDIVIAPDRFLKEASELRGSQYASPLWFSFRFLPGSTDANDDSLVCQSVGLAVFLGRELECGPYRMPPQEMAPIVLFVARYMASAGPVFGDGHTLGFGEDSKSKDARLRYAWSARTGVERPVYRLELGDQKALAQ